MVADGKISVLFCISFFTQSLEYAELTQDQTTARANTLFDDADDIQRQLDNEARDRLKYGFPKTVWVFHLPTTFPDIRWIREMRTPRNSYLFTKRATGSLDTLTRLSISSENSYSYAAPTEATLQQCYSCNYGPLEGSVTQRAMDRAMLGVSLRDQNLFLLGDNYFSFILGNLKAWDYKDQGKWSRLFPECGGRSQSPVNLPTNGLVMARGARRLLFCNYNVPAKSMTVVHDSQSLTLYGKWNKVDQPLIYGGAAHSRRYLFHSLTLHWPSEHVIEGLQYPLESQALHISAEYKTFNDAVAASSSDKLAFLGIVSLYKFANHTQSGLKSILQAATSKRTGYNYSIPAHSIGFFNPPFQEYVTYQGSLTYPPCTEAVLWFVSGRSLPVERDIVKIAHKISNPYNEPMKLLIRQLQPLNDRRIYYFG